MEDKSIKLVIRHCSLSSLTKQDKNSKHYGCTTRNEEFKGINFSKEEAKRNLGEKLQTEDM